MNISSIFLFKICQINHECNKSQEQDSVLNIIEKYKFHPIIKLIKSKNKGLSSSFSFKFAATNEVKKSINNLDPKKASEKEDICTGNLKTNEDYVCNDINVSISSSTFPNQLKEADIIPEHKKKSKLSKENYRSMSIVSNISKVYEMCLYDQLSDYFGNIFSKLQCGFRKGYTACLLAIIEKWKTN